MLNPVIPTCAHVSGPFPGYLSLSHFHWDQVDRLVERPCQALTMKNLAKSKSIPEGAERNFKSRTCGIMNLESISS